MIKLFGVILLLAGFCGLTFEKIRGDVEELKELRQIKDFSAFLLKEIEYSHIPIPDICREYRDRSEGTLKCFLETVCKRYEENQGKSFDVVWTDELKDYEGRCGQKRWLMKMSKEFGFQNVGMQVLAIGQYMTDIEKYIMEKEKKFQDNRKLILYFGVMSGLLISIILL